jgi:hypothetical protein
VFGNEDPVERQDDTVVVLDVGREMVVVGRGLMMVIFEVRVGDHLVAVRPVGAMHVFDRGQRKDRQTRDETQGHGARHEHSRRSYGIARGAATEESLTGRSGTYVEADLQARLRRAV